MRPGRPTPLLELADEERDTLERWARRPKTAQALAQRARMILGCAEGKTNTAVATDLKVSKPTVGKWRSRFLSRGLDGLPDGHGFSGVTLAHNTLAREEVDAVLAEAEAAGATIVKPAQDVFWGGYSGYFTDPDGHLWEVAWNPHFEIE